MRAFKAFNKNMTCTSGKGTYQYKENTIYHEDKAQAHETGFHCAEYILDCYKYYPMTASTVICPVEASGDIDEDGSDTKISCTTMTIGSRLSREEIVFETLKYLAKHSKFKDAKNIHIEKGTDKFICIVRGKDPIASGTKGTVLGILKETARHKVIGLAVYKVDGKKIKPGRFYNINGEEVENEKG